jgi:purine-binding chemotaxis protein CheW
MTRPETRVDRAEYLSFRLGEEEYAIDILQVREIRAHEAVTRIASAPAFVKGVINLRGAIVPIADLRLRFGFEAGEGNGVMIVLDLAHRLVGILVDAVSDVVALAPDQIRPAPSMQSVIDEGFIHGLAPIDDRMLIVLDIARVMASSGMVPAEEEALA